MPFVSVVLSGKISKEQRREIARDISLSLERVAGKPRESVYIAFTEHARDEFAKGEHLTSDLDEMKAKKDKDS